MASLLTTPRADFIAAVKTAIHAGLNRGPVAALPLIDIRVALIDTNWNARDSSAAPFTAAAAAGLAEALRLAGRSSSSPSWS
jgi:translation elongation factor EF-G